MKIVLLTNFILIINLLLQGPVARVRHETLTSHRALRNFVVLPPPLVCVFVCVRERVSE